MYAPEELISKLNIADRFTAMFLAYFKRNLGEQFQYLTMFDFVDIEKDLIVIQFTESASTGSEFPRTELTGYLEEKSFGGALQIIVRCKKRTPTSKTNIIRKVAEVRALMLRGILFRSQEVIEFADTIAAIYPPTFNGAEFEADDDGDSASISWNINFNLSPNFFNNNQPKAE